jgi:hypothetical protein
MSTPNRQRAFVANVLSIQASAQGIFGGGIPGNMGMSSSANQAASTGGDQTVEHLKRSALELAKLHAKQADPAAIAQLISEVEGQLLVAGAQSILTDQQTTHLLDELHAAFGD